MFNFGQNHRISLVVLTYVMFIQLITLSFSTRPCVFPVF